MSFQQNGEIIYNSDFKEEQLIEDEDRIENFDAFLNEIHFKIPEINSLQFHKQIDGICFYKLCRDSKFSDLKFQSKILIDSNMNFKLFINDYLLNEETVGFQKLENWYQLQFVLDNFEVLQGIQMTEKDHFLKAIEHLNSIDSMSDHHEFRKEVCVAKEYLEKLASDLESGKFESVTDPPNESQEQEIEDESEQVLLDSQDDVEDQLEYNFITECCGKILEQQDIENHKCEASQEPKNSLICDLCGQDWDDLNSLTKHILDTHKSAPEIIPEVPPMEICLDCGQEFPNDSSLSNHRKSCPVKPIIIEDFKPKAPPKDKLPCPMEECEVSASTKMLLLKHLRNIHGVEIELHRFCLECKQHFESQNLLVIHKRDHFKFACKICSKKCKTEDSLESHQKIHKPNEIRPHKCTECSGSYKTKSHLKSHYKLIHSKDRSFPCGLCSLLFPDESRLKAHIRKVHNQSEDTPWSCSDCPLQFKEVQQLKSHALVVHSSNLIYFCEICKSKFQYLNELKVHKHQQHKFPLQRRKYMEQGSNLKEEIVESSDFGQDFYMESDDVDS